MNTSVSICRPRRIAADDSVVMAAARYLRQGALVAFPTETVYGLGADATSASAVAAIYRAKHRPADNPLIVHVASLAEAAYWGRLQPAHHRLLERAWPGPLTVVVPVAAPLAAVVGRDTVAIRIPDHPLALALLQATGRPLAAPSANLSGRPSPTTAGHVVADLGDAVAMILDGGLCRVGIESTVLDLSDSPARILRPGSLEAETLAAWLGEAVLGTAGDTARRSPGTRYAHYRPGVPVVVLQAGLSADQRRAWLAAVAVERRCGYIGPAAEAPEGMATVIVADGITLARQFYDGLRRLEAAGVELILVAGVGDHPAVMERLGRAASGWIDQDEPDAAGLIAGLDGGDKA